MTYGTQYGIFRCKKCKQDVYFNEPDHWYSDPTQILKDEWKQMLTHIRECYFEPVEEEK